MASYFKKVQTYVESLLNTHSQEELTNMLIPKYHPPETAILSGNSEKRVSRRIAQLSLSSEQKERIADEESLNNLSNYEHNIENFIGTLKIPLGIAGPLRVNGLSARGDYLIPLATTEAALVASYSRGCQVITRAGGCTSVLLNEGVSRAPGFVFSNISRAGLFIIWVQKQFERFKTIASATTKHGELKDMKFTVEGNHVYLNLEFTTGDAAGQNMVTIATQAICDYIMGQSPIEPSRYYVEANLSGDKKASHQAFHTVRGKKVNSEVIIPAELLRKILHVTPGELMEYWHVSAIGGVLSGTIGCQGHYANGLTALYLACGQDVACVAESAVGLTRMEVNTDGDLYASVNLPNIMVGTVGGGTGLPSQHACLQLMDLAGPGKSRAFAEVCGALCLAGELSIMAAITSGDFTKAHKMLARTKKAPLNG